MKDPSLQDPPDPFAEALLRSAEHDGPTPRDRARVAASLGLAGATTVTASAAKASSAPAAAKASLMGGMVKWWLGGLGVAFLVGTFASAPDRHAAAPVHSSAVDAPRERSAIPSAEPAPAMSSPVVLASSSPSASVSPPRAAMPPPTQVKTTAPTAGPSFGPSSAPVPSTAAPQGPSLADELVALDAARKAIEAGDAAAAEQALSQYRTTVGKGRLASEAELLAIESAAARGDRAQTITLGSAFLAKHPSSPHRARVNTLVARARKETR